MCRINSFFACNRENGVRKQVQHASSLLRSAHTRPHKEHSSRLTHAGVKTRHTGRRMTSQDPAEERVPRSWTVFSHAHKGNVRTLAPICIYEHTPSSSAASQSHQPPPPHVHTNASSPEITLIVPRRHLGFFSFAWRGNVGRSGCCSLFQDADALWKNFGVKGLWGRAGSNKTKQNKGTIPLRCPCIKLHSEGVHLGASWVSSS